MEAQQDGCLPQTIFLQPEARGKLITTTGHGAVLSSRTTEHILLLKEAAGHNRAAILGTEVLEIATPVSTTPHSIQDEAVLLTAVAPEAIHR
jgi:hypothetical protein